MKNKIADNFDIEENTVSCDYSHRGGTIKVNVSEAFPRLLKKRAEDGEYDIELVMGAYQNYLGGGMRGAIVGASMFDPKELNAKELKVFTALKERIKRYFHALTNSDELDMNDEWNTSSYEANQKRSVSAY